MSCLSATLTNAVFAYLCICICVYVFVYLQVRHPGTLFLRSSCHYLFKNIAHVMSICNFDQCCICVFVYLCICICVFASQTPGNIVSEVLLPLPFQKYSTCHVYWQLWPMLYLRICVFVYLYLCIYEQTTNDKQQWKIVLLSLRAVGRLIFAIIS